MFKRHAHIPLIGLFLVLLVSCGGSGGVGNPLGGPIALPPDPASLPITAANAQDITADVLEAVTSSVEILDILDIIGIPVVGNTVPGLAQALVADIFTEAIACDTGQLTVTWDDADNDLAISTGDSFDIVFEMCFFDDTGTTLDGPTSLTNIAITGDPFIQVAPWGWAATFGFDNLSGTDSEGTSTINGALDFSTSSDDNVLVNLSVSTESAPGSLTVQQDGVAESLTAYLLTQTIDLNTLTQVINAAGDFTRLGLQGNVTFETLEDFVVIGDDNPSSGQLLISDSSSSVLVTVIDNINVRLDIDTDLNGIIDTTITVTWAELDID